MKKTEVRKPVKKGLVLSNFHLVLLVIAVMIIASLSAIAGFLYGKNQELQRKEVKTEIKPTPQFTPTPAPPPIPTPSPQIIYKYLEKETDNTEKLKRIDEQIANVKAEIEKVNKRLEENKYSQNSQARSRDLKYQLVQLEVERIRYE